MVIRGAFSRNSSTRQPTNYCRLHMLIPQFATQFPNHFTKHANADTPQDKAHSLSLSLGTVMQGINIP